MPSFTVKNIPHPLFQSLKAAAELHHRSINGEILACLEQSFGVRVEPGAILARARELRARVRGRPLTFEEMQEAKNKGRP